MLRISLNVLVLTAGALLLAFGAIRFAERISGDDGDRILFQTSISHPSLLGGERQRTYIKVDLAGFKLERETRRTPVNVALVLDKSGSMGGEKMEQAKAAAIQAINRLDEGDIVTVITYDNSARVLLPATQVADKAAIQQKIQRLHAGGGTALYAGVVEGAGQLREFLSENRVNRVILLSDGQANSGPDTPAALGELGASLINEGISVTTIGLGLGYNEDLMVELALRSDGNHQFVEHADMLAGIFNQEFGDVLSVVAQDVKVMIECEEGIRPISVLGREARIEGQRVEVALNQLYSEQEKYIMLEVETDSREREGEYEIAQVDLAYANMITNETERFSDKILAEFTRSKEEVEANVDDETMVSAIEQQAVANEERAIELRDAGQQAEAEAVLKENADFLRQNAVRYRSEKLEAEADQSLDAAASLAPEAWNQQRKAMRSDHYKAKTQQKQ